MSDAVLRAEAILRAACGDRVRTRFPMAPLTSFRIGGPAALYLEPASARDLVAAGRAVSETGLPLIVVGKGSNILVSDAGFDGLVLRLGKGFRWAARDGSHLSAGGAMPLPALAGIALRHDLAGLEFGVAIPASLGGAVRMNAGAHGHEIAEVVERVETFRLRSGTIASVPASEAGFAYRRSELPEDAVVTAATVALVPADATAIRGSMDDARDWRRRTQPLAEPNCGSVFKNPPGNHAAHLIEEAGLKGRSVGGASVSTKHANFIVAGPGARAADVVSLIGEVQELVERRSGLLLEPEVHLVGEFDHVPR
jgi:UDP-N-acetylmuramate dehydrogenase